MIELSWEYLPVCCILTLFCCHVTYAFHTLYSCLNATKLLAGSCYEICRLSDYKWVQT